jgi:hypothetical protein
MVLTSGYSMSLPIFQAETKAGQIIPIPTALVGSCFALGGNYMMTAGHVAPSATDENRTLVVGIYRPDTGLDVATVTDVEQLGCDLAILRIDLDQSQMVDRFHRFGWSDAQLDTFTPVRSVGYAYGVQHVEDRHLTIVRGFQGHIVTRLARFKPAGMAGPPFEVYESSFVAPRGLSGALLTNTVGKAVIHGVVIGNSESQMMIFRDEERVQTDRTHTVERYEALTLGIAVPASEVFGQTSQLLGSTVYDHLNQHGLLAESSE